MNEITVVNVLTKALVSGVMIAGPILIASLLVGLGVSIFQAVTQIQEQSLTFVPKLIVIVSIVVFGGPWMMSKLTTLTVELFGMIANITR